MTLPSITASKQREELKASLKKNYSIIQQVFLHLASDNGGSLRPEDIGGWTLKNDMMKYMKVIKDCGYGALEADACVSNMYNNPELSSTKYKTFDGRLISSLTYFDDGQFILSDGSFYMLENNKNSILITVDVNGINKNPNQWGYDLFTFQLTDKGKLLPMGAEGTDYTDDTYCSKTSTNINFLNAVNPKYALIGVGKNNKFGHPSKETIKKLNDLNVKIYRTDELGEITINVNKRVAISTY